MAETARERFAAHVDTSRGPGQCHPWTGALTPSGYGVFHPVKGRTVRANRYALELELGRPLHPGKWALHHCDFPPCCNVLHLYEGDHAQNTADAVARRRNIFGTRVPSHRMTPAAVLELRTRFATGEPITQLYREFGISIGAASKIVNGKTWAAVGGPLRTTTRPGPRPRNERTPR